MKRFNTTQRVVLCYIVSCCLVSLTLSAPSIIRISLQYRVGKVYFLRKKLVIIFASFIRTELVSLPGRTRKYGNLAPFGINLDENFHIIVVCLGIFVAAPVIVIKWTVLTEWLTKRKNVRDDFFEQNGGNLLLPRNRNEQLILYSAQQMNWITNGYASTYPKLGSCHGRFFKGTLLNEERTEVLVVEVERVPQPQLNQFVDQLIFLSQPHVNVLRVLGCCLEKISPLIVYEGTRSLSECTRGDHEERVRAATGVARGLAYLNSHKFSGSRFVHGDICTATILVDASYNAKIFYAAGSNLIPPSSDDPNLVYRDPDFISSRKLNKKSDVYSFGVVLVELLSTGGGMALESYVDLAKAGRLLENLERERNIIAERMRGVAIIAATCLHENPNRRPSMKKVKGRLSMLMP